MKTTTPKFKKGDSVQCSLKPTEVLKIKEEPIWNGREWMYAFNDTDLRCGQSYLTDITNYQKLLLGKELNKEKHSHQAIDVPNKESGINLLLIKKNNDEFIFDAGGNILVQSGNAKDSLEFWQFLSELCEGAINELKDKQPIEHGTRKVS